MTPAPKAAVNDARPLRFIEDFDVPRNYTTGIRTRYTVFEAKLKSRW